MRWWKITFLSLSSIFIVLFSKNLFSISCFQELVMNITEGNQFTKARLHKTTLKRNQEEQIQWNVSNFLNTFSLNTSLSTHKQLIFTQSIIFHIYLISTPIGNDEHSHFATCKAAIASKMFNLDNYNSIIKTVCTCKAD